MSTTTKKFSSGEREISSTPASKYYPLDDQKLNKKVILMLFDKLEDEISKPQNKRLTHNIRSENH